MNLRAVLLQVLPDEAKDGFVRLDRLTAAITWADDGGRRRPYILAKGGLENGRIVVGGPGRVLDHRDLAISPRGDLELWKKFGVSKPRERKRARAFLRLSTTKLADKPDFGRPYAVLEIGNLPDPGKLSISRAEVVAAWREGRFWAEGPDALFPAIGPGKVTKVTELGAIVRVELDNGDTAVYPAGSTVPSVGDRVIGMPVWYGPHPDAIACPEDADEAFQKAGYSLDLIKVAVAQHYGTIIDLDGRAYRLWPYQWAKSYAHGPEAVVLDICGCTDVQAVRRPKGIGPHEAENGVAWSLHSDRYAPFRRELAAWFAARRTGQG